MSITSTPTLAELELLVSGDFEDNNIVDEACAKRLVNLCSDYGTDGAEAKILLKLAFQKLDVYI